MAEGAEPTGRLAPGGFTLIDDATNATARGTVERLKSVTMSAGAGQRVIAVVGALDFSDDSAYDSLESWGALVVRLNVTSMIAVGPTARAMFLSVGREGSWDGESQHALDIPGAYDEIRALVRPGDVVLVMGSLELPMEQLVGRLMADAS